jgi:hypothetical protein
LPLTFKNKQKGHPHGNDCFREGGACGCEVVSLNAAALEAFPGFVHRLDHDV